MMFRETIALGAMLVALGACQTQTEPMTTGTATSDQLGIDEPTGSQAATAEEDPVGGDIGGPRTGAAQPPGADDDDEAGAGTGGQDPVGGDIGGPGSGAASPGGAAQ